MPDDAEFHGSNATASAEANSAFPPVKWEEYTHQNVTVRLSEDPSLWSLTKSMFGPEGILYLIVALPSQNYAPVIGELGPGLPYSTVDGDTVAFRAALSKHNDLAGFQVATKLFAHNNKTTGDITALTDAIYAAALLPREGMREQWGSLDDESACKAISNLVSRRLYSAMDKILDVSAHRGLSSIVILHIDHGKPLLPEQVSELPEELRELFCTAYPKPEAEVADTARAA